MARQLGRMLRDDEVVHHINGDTLDNRPEDLELWSTMQPKGQRWEDEVEWPSSYFNGTPRISCARQAMGKSNATSSDIDVAQSSPEGI